MTFTGVTGVVKPIPISRHIIILHKAWIEKKVKVTLLTLMFLIIVSPAIIMVLPQAYAQDSPFEAGTSANPFEVGGGGSSSAPAQSNTTLQIRSDTDWSGT